MQNLAILGMGLTSLLAQITALRRLLTVFSGNELVLGITLAVWLLFVGSGSALGSRIVRQRSFGLSFLVVAFLLQPTILLINLLPALFSLVPGETASLAITIASTILVLAPLCLAIGAQFPLGVAWFWGDSARVYGLEAGGAFIGGVAFTFMLAGRVDAFTLAVVVSVMNILIALVLLRDRRVVLLLLIPLIFHFGARLCTDFISDHELETIQRVESPYGEVAVSQSAGQLNLSVSGKFAFAYPDTQTDELKAHIPMSLHALPSRILVIGGSPAVALELLKYGEVAVDHVELDKRLIDISISMLSEDARNKLQDKRLSVLAVDARSHVKASSSRYDLVLLNLPEPSTASLNRFYTVEFFRETKASMRANGILALTLPASHGYIGRRMQTANGSIYRSLKSVFANVALSSEEYGSMYASDGPIDTSPGALIERFSKMNITTVFFHPYLFNDIFDPMKQNMVQTRLDTVETINSDRRPTAYLYNLMLWADMHGGKGLQWVAGLKDWQVYAFCAALMLPAFALFRKRNAVLYYSLFTTGFATMAFSLIVLLAYQAAYGSVYEKIGLLTALFMAGSAAGAGIARRINVSLTRFQLLEAACILLLFGALPDLRLEALYYALTFLGGLIGGAAFVLVNRMADSEASGALAGRLYALDLGGAVLGALLTTIFLVPLLGIVNAALVLIMLKGTSLALLFSAGKT